MIDAATYLSFHILVSLIPLACLVLGAGVRALIRRSRRRNAERIRAELVEEGAIIIDDSDVQLDPCECGDCEPCQKEFQKWLDEWRMEEDREYYAKHGNDGFNDDDWWPMPPAGQEEAYDEAVLAAHDTIR